jgi:hypothetical protein
LGGDFDTFDTFDVFDVFDAELPFWAAEAGLPEATNNVAIRHPTRTTDNL